jgi:AcrR family transcriptional regulator
MSMPRYVDHDARRRRIAATAAQIAGTRGLDALTYRNLADATGSSTTVLTHYFADKRDLLLSTFQAVAERSGARFDEAKRQGRGLRECLEALLPLDAERQTEWRVLTCFWGTAVSDPGAAGEQARHVRSAQSRIEALLRERYPQTAEVELGAVARRLAAVVHGLGAHSALDPHHWSPADQRRVLSHELGSLSALDRADGGELAAGRPRKHVLAAARQGPDRAARRRGSQRGRLTTQPGIVQRSLYNTGLRRVTTSLVRAGRKIHWRLSALRRRGCRPATRRSVRAQ